MHEARGVDRREAVTGSDVVAKHVPPVAQRLVLPVAQRATLDQRHGDEHLVTVQAALVYADDVGVVDRGEGLGLAQQASALERVILLAQPQELDRDLAPELGVRGEEHLTHATTAERVAQQVLADPRRLRRLRRL